MASAIDYTALADFRYEIRRFLNFSEQAVRIAGVESQQHQALLVIKGLREIKVTIGVLAERLQIQHHSAVELTDRLQARGFIRRMRSRSDRRQVFLQLTIRGEKLLRHLSLVHRAELRTAGPKLIKTLKEAVHHGERTRPFVEPRSHTIASEHAAKLRPRRSKNKQ